MNIHAVRLFLEVVELGSLSKVAARRQTVQSHISRQVTEFEAGFGAPLFHRTGRGVVLTEFGHRVAHRLRAWLQETEGLVAELQAESSKVQGEVRLGIIPSAAHPLATRLFTRLQAEHPAIRLNIAEAQGTELDVMLDSGAVDLAILFRYRRPTGSDERLLGVAHTFLVSAPGDSLTAKATVDFARLANKRLVLPRRPSHWRTALDETARSLGFRLDAAAEADSLTVQKELVALTPGLYSILGPYTVEEDIRLGRLQASRLASPDLRRHVTLAFPKQGKLSPASRAVARTIEELVVSWGQKLTEPHGSSRVQPAVPRGGRRSLQ